jgi:hypothetical protein
MEIEPKFAHQKASGSSNAPSSSSTSLENRDKKIAPHSYSTAPFARSNLSSAAATSLLHRRGFGRSNVNIPSLTVSHAGASSINQTISPRSIKPLSSPSSSLDSSSSNNSPNTSFSLDTKNQSSTKSKWDPKNPSVIDETAGGLLPLAVIKDEKQAKKNDLILQERIMEAKSMNPKAQSGATVHKFSLWNAVKSQAKSSTTSETSSATALSELPAFDVSGGIKREDLKPLISSPNELILPKSTKSRGPKAAIERQGQFDVDVKASKTSKQGYEESGVDQSKLSRSNTPQRESRPNRSVIMPDLAQAVDSQGLEALLPNSKGQGKLTSSLRSKIDSASKASTSSHESMDFDLVKRIESSSKPKNKSKKSKSKEAATTSSSGTNSRRESVGSFIDDDVDDECVSLGSVEEEEESRVNSRPPSEHSVNEDRQSIGRPPLPSIRQSSSSSDSINAGNASHQRSTRHRSGSQSSAQNQMPAVRRSLGSQSQSASPLLPEMQPSLSISPSQDLNLSIFSEISPPPVSKLKQRQYSDERVRKSNEIVASRDYSSAPGSPRTTPKALKDFDSEGLFPEPHADLFTENRPRNARSKFPLPLEATADSFSIDRSPKAAFRSRAGSAAGSDNGSGNNSFSSQSQSFKEDGLPFSFVPIRDTPPDSRSHSIFMASDSSLALTLQSLDLESTPFADDKKQPKKSSPDYGDDIFDSPSPTLSVMSHMSDTVDPADRYEQLVYSKSVSSNPSPQPPAASKASSNPFASGSSNPFASSAKPTVSSNPFARITSGNIGSKSELDSKLIALTKQPTQQKSQKQQELKSEATPRGFEFNTVPFSEDESNGYSEVMFVGVHGENIIRWQKGQPIGEGTFGRVYKGLNKSTGELAAVKQLGIGNGTEAEIESIGREIQVMWQLDHENIVRYLGTSRSSRYLFIVLEYISGGSIASMLQQFGSFSESLIRKFSYHIVCGVDYLHNKGIIHRDIKGGNVLVTDTGVAKIADFGCSKQLAGLCTTSLEESLKTIRGSVPWMAPEVIKQAGHGRSSDIWSIGATVIEMATGKPPWSEFSNNLAALFHVATSKEPPPVPEHLSRSCAMFLSK